MKRVLPYFAVRVSLIAADGHQVRFASALVRARSVEAAARAPIIELMESRLQERRQLADDSIEVRIFRVWGEGGQHGAA